MKKFKVRNQTKRWSKDDDGYLLLTTAPMWYQALKLGRTNTAIVNRKRKLIKK